MAQASNPEDRIPLGSPYCSDPNCVYCKDLREFTEELRRSNEWESRNAGDAELPHETPEKPQDEENPEDEKNAA